MIKRACTVAPQVEKAWPRPIAKALLARVPRIGPHKASFPRPITCGAGFSLWRCRVERAVRSRSLRAWAIGRAQMAIPSKECTLLHTIYNTRPVESPSRPCFSTRQRLANLLPSPDKALPVQGAVGVSVLLSIIVSEMTVSFIEACFLCQEYSMGLKLTTRDPENFGLLILVGRKAKQHVRHLKHSIAGAWCSLCSPPHVPP